MGRLYSEPTGFLSATLMYDKDNEWIGTAFSNFTKITLHLWVNQSATPVCMNSNSMPYH